MNASQHRLFISVLLLAPILALSGCAANTSRTDTREEKSAFLDLEFGTHASGGSSSQHHKKFLPRLNRDGAAAEDIWERLRQGFQLDQPEDPRVQREMDWLAANSSFLERSSQRAQPYLYYIVNEAERRGMPLELALLPLIESGFQPNARSPYQALGLWQFVPGTARDYGLKQTYWYEGRCDVMASTKAALDYLQWLSEQFDGDWQLALAAYNAGPGRVRQAIERNEEQALPTDFWSLDLPEETRQYVPRLLAVARLVAEPKEHQIDLAAIPNTPHFTRVEIPGQIDLAVAAKLAEVPREKLTQLNPGFLRGTTDPEGPHFLLLPTSRAKTFAERLKELAPEDRVTWRRYQIRRGESLGTIASRFGMNQDRLRKVNQLQGKSVRAGQYLLIPTSSDEDQTVASKTLLASANSESDKQKDGIRTSDTASPKTQDITARKDKTNEKSNPKTLQVAFQDNTEKVITKISVKPSETSKKQLDAKTAQVTAARGKFDEKPSTKAIQVVLKGKAPEKPIAKSTQEATKGKVNEKSSPKSIQIAAKGKIDEKPVKPAAKSTQATTKGKAAASTQEATRKSDQPSDKGRSSRAVKKVYVVRPGDTLLAIARAHGLDHRELAARNRLPPNSSLRAGQTLQLS